MSDHRISTTADLPDDQLLPDILDGMSMSTGAGITDAELLGEIRTFLTGLEERHKYDRTPWPYVSELRAKVDAAMRAVASRTRPATPAPAPALDAMAEHPRHPLPG